MSSARNRLSKRQPLNKSLNGSDLKRSTKNKTMLTWFSSARSRKAKPGETYDIRENPNAASRASTKVRFDDPAPEPVPKSDSNRVRGNSMEIKLPRQTSFLGLSKTLRRKGNKKKDDIKEMLQMFNQSDFEFEVDNSKEHIPNDIDLHDDKLEEAKVAIGRHNEEEQENIRPIRDTYISSIEEGNESKGYNKHLSISSAPQLKFSMISAAPAPLEAVPLDRSPFSSGDSHLEASTEHGDGVVKSV